MGGPKYFLGGHDCLTILILIESNIFRKLLTSNVMSIDGGPMGGPGGPDEGG